MRLGALLPASHFQPARGEKPLYIDLLNRSIVNFRDETVTK